MCCFFYHHHGRRDGIKDKKLESTTLLVVGWYTIARSHQNLRPQKTRESSSSSSGDVVMMGCCHPKVILPSQTTTLSWWEVTKSCSMERTWLLDDFWGKMRLGSCRRAWCLHQLKGGCETFTLIRFRLFLACHLRPCEETRMVEQWVALPCH